MIDTATKRLTISNLTLPWRMIGPVPDGATSISDRVAYGYLYAHVYVLAGTICIRDGEIKSARSIGSIKAARSTGRIGVAHSTGTIEVC